MTKTNAEWNDKLAAQRAAFEDHYAAENERRGELQRQYDTVKELAAGNDRALLEWMTQQARKAGMSYGYFVSWLRR